MTDINQILEKIITLNINTNIDVEQLVRNYILIQTAGYVAITLIICSTVLAVVYFLYKGATKHVDEEALDRMNEILQSFNSWEKVDSVNKRLDEILTYMPRNKRPRRKS